MARDPLELRRHAPTVPTDLLDPPRFGQMVESAKDALVEELRTFLSTTQFTVARRVEAASIEKYAGDFGGLDPYPTFTKIVEMFPDVRERLPHIAVTTASGDNRRRTAGRPFIAHVQAPPRVVTGVAGPYALANPVAQRTVFTVLTSPGTYEVVLASVPFPVVVAAGTTADAADAIASSLRGSAAGELFRISSSGSTCVVEAREPGVPFTVGASANLGVATTAAGAATEPDRLVIRTRPGGRGEPMESTIRFQPSRFATSEPLSAVPAEALARVFNEQALYAEARVVPVGMGEGVQFATGGRLGGRTPNEIEVLSASTPALVAALGLGTAGTAGAGASIAGVRPSMTVTVAGTPFVAAMVGRFFVLSGATSSVNAGRFRIIGVPATNQLVIENSVGVAEALPAGATWFIGLRDDSRNGARPVMNRYHAAVELSVTVDVFAESPNERTELFDLLFSEFIFFLEQKHFTLYGRGVFDEAYPDEHYQVTVHQEVGNGGESDFARGEDQKNRMHAGRLRLPVTVTWFLDRAVTVASGPSAGASWTLEGENVMQDDTLPPPN